MATKKKLADMNIAELRAELRKEKREKARLIKQEKESRKIPVDTSEKKVDEYADIRPDTYVRVISLCPHPLNLSTARVGGKQFRFDKLGKMKRILYGDLVDIIENQPSFAENGVFYIADEAIVRRHGLVDYYDKILTKEEVNMVMTADSDIALAIFKNANPKQQGYISEMLIEKIVEGEDVDMNFAYLVGKDIGVDIIKKAEEEKEYKDMLIKEK